MSNILLSVVMFEVYDLKILFDIVMVRLVAIKVLYLSTGMLTYNKAARVISHIFGVLKS